MKPWEGHTGFEWDEGNAGKNWERHAVADFECEEVFFRQPLIVRHDPGHGEARWVALGRAARDRELFVAFTVRRAQIRVISVRDMTRRERKAYEDYEKREKTENRTRV